MGVFPVPPALRLPTTSVGIAPFRLRFNTLNTQRFNAVTKAYPQSTKGIEPNAMIYILDNKRLSF